MTAAALVVTPVVGAIEVNGELLAAPLVALGIGACLAAGRARTPRRAGLWWVGAGAAGAAALLVKQNIADVLVFGLVLVATSTLRAQVPRRRAVRAVGLGVGGAVLLTTLVTLWALAHGTSPSAVAWAMYPFRLHAGQVLAGGGSRYAETRGARMVGAWVLSGLAPLTALLVAGTARARLRDPVLVALVATVAFDLVSVGLGGGYWVHYLLELVVPLSLAAGILAGRARDLLALLTRAAVGFASVSAVVAVGVVAVHPPQSDGQAVGAAVRAVAAPGDTLTTLYGEPQVDLAAAMASPYPHLWSLPTRVLDPHLHDLDTVLTGPEAPTWLVVARRVATWGLDTARTQAVIDARYHRVTVVAGQSIYLRDGVARRAPVSTPSLTAAAAG